MPAPAPFPPTRGPSATTTAALEVALRAAVRNVYHSGDLEDLTVRRIRKMVEVEKGLEEGWFKSEEGGWRERSKWVIEGEVDACAAADPSSQHVSAKSTPKKKGEAPPVAGLEEGSKARKRKNPEAVDEGRTKKRRSKHHIDDENEEDGAAAKLEKEHVDVEEAQGSNPHVNKRRATSTLSPPPEEEEAETSQGVSTPAKPKVNGPAAEDSESDMSVLIDEPPKKRGRSKAKQSEPAKQEKKSAQKKNKQQQRKTSTTAEESADPGQEEIKRLQGWLVKCGMRKMWWKELQPYETSKAKIKHLKEMLAEVGMSGRYSLEKASQIREERELRADLEAVQEGAKIWGKGEDEEGDVGGGRPKRQIAKGLQGLDFLNDEDGEETD